MKRLLIATTNPGKLREYREFLSDLNLKLLSLSDVGITDDIEETGKTYKENSQKKALFYAKRSGSPAISDDGGIEISALNNEPGIKSRRWLGYNSTDEGLIKHMMKVSKQLPENNRNAVFKLVVSLALPNGKVYASEGRVEGIIAKDPHMKLLHGYPYRSFFYLPDIQKYYHESELTRDEMRKYNHRYKAIQKLKPIIIKELID
ncbi:MAG: non-canonical purine NTP pyrophosphatase [Candidatus Levybacteria bacterium]|nr:non-canonical purine NTP pyrophosphatase [Candidatus Levybacteria bacterium]